MAGGGGGGGGGGAQLSILDDDVPSEAYEAKQHIGNYRHRLEQPIINIYDINFEEVAYSINNFTRTIHKLQRNIYMKSNLTINHSCRQDLIIRKNDKYYNNKITISWQLI